MDNKSIIYQGDCKNIMKQFDENSFDAIVTDPPYELNFMGKGWDASGIANDREMWEGCLRVLKPGGHLLAFGGTRTYHRMACAIEDAGFEIRDSIHWVYGSGFPKSLSIDKALDKMAGAERETIGIREDFNKRARKNGVPSSDYIMAGGWKSTSETVGILTAPATEAAKQWAGWGTALKPAHEIVVLARKPISEKTIAENVLKWGCGGINIDESRVKITDKKQYEFNFAGRSRGDISRTGNLYSGYNYEKENPSQIGRFPANLIHDGSEEVLAEFAKAGERKVGYFSGHRNQPKTKNDYGAFDLQDEKPTREESTGSAARFFKACSFEDEDIPAFVYYAKASKKERGEGNNHPTVKPINLIRYLIKLICPKDGLILDPFIGSGTTLLAGKMENINVVGIELNQDYIDIIKNRCQYLLCNPN